MKNRRSSPVPHGGVASHPKLDHGSGEPDRHRQISEAAYFRAQQRGFAPGQELEDWVIAETQFSNGAGPCP